MSHRVFKASDAHKLEDPARLEWLPPADILRELALQPGLKVADIGAGTGYFSLPFAQAIGDTGHVFAVDLQPEMLHLLREKLARPGSPANVSLHQGDACHSTLAPASVDLIFFANVWHEFPDLDCVLREALRIAAPHARIAILDWRPDCASPPGPPTDHRIAPASVVEFLSKHGCPRPVHQNVGRYHYLVTAALPSQAS